MPLSASVYLSLSLSASVCLRLSLSVSVCLCLPLSDYVCLCLLLYVSVCHCLPLSASIRLPGAEDDGVAEVGGRDGGAALCVQAVTVPAVAVLDTTH